MDNQNTNARNGVIALNILFACILAAVTFAPSSDANTTATQRYIAIPGIVNGMPMGAVYIADTTQQELVAVTYDPNNLVLKNLGYRNLASDAQTVPGM